MAKSNAVSAKVRALYGVRLNKDDYDELLSKRSVGEIAGYLKRCEAYKNLLYDVKENSIHRGQLELLMRKDLYEKMISLMNYADSKEKAFYRFPIIYAEIKFLLSKIIHLMNENNDKIDFISTIPMYINGYTTYNLINVAKSESFNSLFENLKESKYYIILQLNISNNEVNYVNLEKDLFKYYYEYIFDNMEKINKSSRKELLDMFNSEIELNNIIKIYRLKKYYNLDDGIIEENLLDTNSRFKKSKLVNMMKDKHCEEFIKELINNKYKITIDENNNLENAVDTQVFAKAKKMLIYSTNANSVYTSYYYLHLLEIKNVINIIEGIRYSRNIDDISCKLVY